MTNPVRKHIPTSAQVLKEQKERADRERETRLAAGRKVVAQQPAAKQPQDEIERLTNQAVAPAKATSVAVPDTRTPQQAYLDEIAPPSSLVGRPIKFDGKAGKWLFSDTDEEIRSEHRLRCAMRRNSDRLDQVHRQGRAARPPDEGIVVRRLHHAAAEHTP